MPYEDPDPQDPMMLVGVELPAGVGAQQDMVYAIAEEFARMGHDENEILALFRQPFYAAIHGAWLALGEDAVKAIIAETASVWARTRWVERDSEPGGGPRDALAQYDDACPRETCGLHAPITGADSGLGCDHVRKRCDIEGSRVHCPGEDPGHE